MIAHLQGKLVEKHQLKSLSTAEVLDITEHIIAYVLIITKKLIL
jgi:hypothetical protein